MKLQTRQGDPHVSSAWPISRPEHIHNAVATFLNANPLEMKANSQNECCMVHVLLIENDEHLARMISWILCEEGHDVTRVRHADDFLRAVRENRPPIVVVNSDLVAELRNERNAVIKQEVSGVLVLDVHPLSAHMGGCTKADAFLHQPFDAEDLLAAVRDLATNLNPNQRT